jgi:Uma2 family endonuclease
MMTPIQPTPPLLHLENGDHLNRAEFEQRYQAQPDLKKAELIEGVVFMGSPVRIRSHAAPHSIIITWLGLYQAATPGVMLGDNPTVRLDLDNEPQPDAILRLERNGQSTISEDDYIEGAPELVVEIAASSASYDLHEKLKVYRRNGVREYLVWIVQESAFCWYQLENGEYILQDPDPPGLLHSHGFAGLILAVDALMAGDWAEVLRVVQNGMESEAHQAFVHQLQR